MDLQKHKRIFNFISPVYNLFFKYQAREMRALLNAYLPELGLPSGGMILDIGCGTGALIHTLQSFGFEAQGVDISEGMLKYAKARGLKCQLANVLEGLPFADGSFDLVTVFFVAHGLDREKRAVLFKEAARTSKTTVLIHEYSPGRTRLIDFVEYLEGGDYFNFVKTGADEMRGVFRDVREISIKPTSSWYICRC